MVEVDTPSWFTPASVIWRDRERKQAYRRAVASGAHFLVREVGVGVYDNALPYSLDEIRDSVDATERQFALLDKCDINTPLVEWYAHQQSKGGAYRLIARVAIIEGLDIFALFGTPLYDRCRQQIDQYEGLTTIDSRFWDVHPDQCVIGFPRSNTFGTFGTYMVDVEPREWHI